MGSWRNYSNRSVTYFLNWRRYETGQYSDVIIGYTQEHGERQVATNRCRRGQNRVGCSGINTGRAQQAEWTQRPGARWHNAGSSLTLGAYNCEEFLTAAHYIVEELLPQCDILFLSEVWLSSAEETYLPTVLSSLDSADFHYVQRFAMELPPRRAGEGRPRGGVALICRHRSGLSFRACADKRNFQPARTSRA